MRVWAVANQKGGVGKTTSTVNLAGPLAMAGRNTLLIDLDPHGSLTSYFGYDPDGLERSAYQLFVGDVHPRHLVLDTGIPHLSLLPASTAMATLDRQLGSQEGKGLVVAQALKKLTGQFSYVLIDCPPVLGVLMINAMAACEKLLVPVQTEFLALKGLERMVHTLDMVMKAQQHELPYQIIPTMFDRRTRAAHTSLASLRETYPYSVWHDVIPVDTQFREASRMGLPLSVMNPKSRGALAYRRLLTDLLRDVYQRQPASAAVI